MRRGWDQLTRAFHAFWRGLREWSGDAAYETYVRSIERSGNPVTVSREEFYVEQLQKKYARPSRCC